MRITSPRYRVVPLVVALVTVLGTLGASPVQAASPQTLVLKSTDLPRGFKQTKAAVITNVQLARTMGISAKAYRTHGGTTGYQTEFHRNATSGLLTVRSTVSPFTGQSGAHWFYGRVENFLAIALLGHSARGASVKGLGNESALITTNSTGKPAHTSVTIIFRRGKDVATVLATGIAKSVSTSQVISLARAVDHRIPPK